MYLPASCRARRIFCRLFHQHAEQITISSNDNNAPKAMPTLAPTERWGPQVGSPGMPQSPALSVKLQISTVNTCSRDLVTIPLPKKYQTICFHNLEYENFLYLKSLRLNAVGTYLKLALCKSLPPSAAGTLPDKELPLRFLHHLD